MDPIVQTMKMKLKMLQSKFQNSTKLSLNLFKQNKIRNLQQFHHGHSPLINIKPSSLSKMPQKRSRISRQSCSSRHGDINQKHFTQQPIIIKIQQKIKQDPNIYRTAQLKNRKVTTNIQIDFQIKKQSSSKLKKCACGDCEQCLKDFSYFLNIFSHDRRLPQISAKSWCIWKRGKNLKFTYYFGKCIHKSRQIASLTKMITAMTVIDFLKYYNFDPNIIKYAIRKPSTLVGGTSANLQINQIYTINQLLFAMMLPSGNDAAIALLEVIGLLFQLKLKNKNINPHNQHWYQQYIQPYQKNFYSNFMLLINEKCQKMGLINTKIYNSHGNDAYDQYRNVSTCNQIAKVSVEYIQKYQYLKNISNTKLYRVERYNKIWQNTNKLLQDGFQGIKTGINQSSGPCLSAYYKDFIVVVLNSRSINQRWVEVKKLIRWILKKGV